MANTVKRKPGRPAKASSGKTAKTTAKKAPVKKAVSAKKGTTAKKNSPAKVASAKKSAPVKKTVSAKKTANTSIKSVQSKGGG